MADAVKEAYSLDLFVDNSCLNCLCVKKERARAPKHAHARTGPPARTRPAAIGLSLQAQLGPHRPKCGKNGNPQKGNILHFALFFIRRVSVLRSSPRRRRRARLQYNEKGRLRPRRCESTLLKHIATISGSERSFRAQLDPRPTSPSTERPPTGSDAPGRSTLFNAGRQLLR